MTTKRNPHGGSKRQLGTPRAVIEAIETADQLRFDWDLAASEGHGLFGDDRRYGPEHDEEYIKKTLGQWSCGWLNPPFHMMTWAVERASDLRWEHRKTVAMICHVDPSTDWFRSAWISSSARIFLAPRVNYIDLVTGQEVKGNPKPSMVFLWGPSNYHPATSFLGWKS